MSEPVYRRSALALAHRLVDLSSRTPRATLERRAVASLGRIEPGLLVRGATVLIRLATGRTPSVRKVGPGEVLITIPTEPEVGTTDVPEALLEAVSRIGQLPISIEPEPGKPGCFRVSWPPAPGLGSWLLPTTRAHAASDAAHGLLLEFDQAREDRGRLEGLVSTLRDVVAQRDRALALSEARYRALVEDVAIGIFLVDVNGQVIFASPRAAAMLGIELGAGSDREIATLIEPRVAPALEDRLTSVRQELTAIEFEATRRRAQGVHPDDEPGEQLQVTLSPLDGGPRIVGSVQRAIQPEVSQRLVEAQRLEALGRMASALAHQVNNPAAAVQLNLESLRRQVSALEPGAPTLDPGVIELLGISIDETVVAFARIGATLADLLTLAGEHQVRLKSCDVDQTIARAVRLVEERLSQVAVLELDFSARSDVQADESLFTQLVVNLLSNAATAIEHGPRLPGTIRVRSRRVGDLVTIEVFDTGCGLDPAELPRLSQPLVTGWTTAPSTGLGLATCVRVLDLVGGTLGVDSRAGGPTTFLVTLPLATGERRPREVAARGAAGARADGRRRVLVVDDERPILRAVDRLLRHRHDVTTTDSIDQFEALLAGGERFDVVICDLNMPQRSIVSAFDDLRDRHPWLEQRLVICTGGGFSDDARRFVVERGLRLLEKPFTPEELEAVLTEVS